MVKDEVNSGLQQTSSMGQKNDKGLRFSVAVREAPQTQLRRPATTLDKYIEKPGVGRANQVVTKEDPQGSRQYSDRELVMYDLPAFSCLSIPYPMISSSS